MGFLGNMFGGDNDEILFFILVFLFLFSGNFLGANNPFKGIELFDNNILFFIVLFLLLFFNNDRGAEPELLN